MHLISVACCETFSHEDLHLGWQTNKRTSRAAHLPRTRLQWAAHSSPIAPMCSILLSQTLMRKAAGTRPAKGLHSAALHPQAAEYQETATDTYTCDFMVSTPGG